MRIRYSSFNDLLALLLFAHTILEMCSRIYTTTSVTTMFDIFVLDSIDSRQSGNFHAIHSECGRLSWNDLIKNNHCYFFFLFNFTSWHFSTHLSSGIRHYRNLLRPSANGLCWGTIGSYATDEMTERDQRAHATQAAKIAANDSVLTLEKWLISAGHIEHSDCFRICYAIVNSRKSDQQKIEREREKKNQRNCQINPF